MTRMAAKDKGVHGPGSPARSNGGFACGVSVFCGGNKVDDPLPDVAELSTWEATKTSAPRLTYRPGPLCPAGWCTKIALSRARIEPLRFFNETGHDWSTVPLSSRRRRSPSLSSWVSCPSSGRAKADSSASCLSWTATNPSATFQSSYPHSNSASGSAPLPAKRLAWIAVTSRNRWGLFPRLNGTPSSLAIRAPSRRAAIASFVAPKVENFAATSIEARILASARAGDKLPFQYGSRSFHAFLKNS